MAVCKFCGKEKTGASSCIESFIIIDKKKYRPIPYKKPENIFTKEQNQKRCPDCNIMPGGYHHVGCSMEICPRCSSRWVQCRCSGVKVKIDENKDKECKIIQFNEKQYRRKTVQDLFEIIRERRSVRKYEEKDIPGDILNQILEAVRWAPSWANTQCWEIVVVKDMTVKEKLQESFPPKGNPATKAVVAAPVVLALCAKLNSSGYYKDLVTTKFGDWFMFDLGIAAQTICLAAHKLGLGTVITGLFDHDKAREVLKVPEGYELVSIIPMGYPAKKSSAPKRKEMGEFTHYDGF